MLQNGGDGMSIQAGVAEELMKQEELSEKEVDLLLSIYCDVGEGEILERIKRESDQYTDEYLRERITTARKTAGYLI